jgi:hypothetical protein
MLDILRTKMSQVHRGGEISTHTYEFRRAGLHPWVKSGPRRRDWLAIHVTPESEVKHVYSISFNLCPFRGRSIGQAGDNQVSSDTAVTTCQQGSSA